jgi:hypothetical protein
MDTRSLLMQMCASRLQQGGNPATLRLFEQLSGGTGAPSLDASELLAQLSADNPMARMVSEHLAQQAAARATPEVIDVPAEPVPDEEEPARQAASTAEHDAVLDLKNKAEAMFEELEVLRRRNEELAWALGACPLCWGGDAECRSCRGRGRAGFRFPDARAFLAHVVPAARMWRLQQQDADAGRRRAAARTNEARVATKTDQHE